MAKSNNKKDKAERKRVKVIAKTKAEKKKCEKAEKICSDRQKSQKRKEVPPTSATHVAKKAKKEKTDPPQPGKKTPKQVSQKHDKTKKKTEGGAKNVDQPPAQPVRRLSGKTKPQDAISSTPSETTAPSPCKELFPDQASGIASPAVSLASLHAWKKEATERGLSLEQYMEEVSQKELEANLEAHMTKLVAEQKADHEEQDSSSDSSDSSDQEGSEESEDDDDDGEHETTKEKNPEDSEGESGDDGSQVSEDGSEIEDLDGEEMDQEDEAVIDGIDKQLALPAPAETPTAPPTATPAAPAAPVAPQPAAPTGQSQVAMAAIQQKESPPQPPTEPAEADQYAKANSRTHKAEWDKFSRQCIDRKKFPCTLAAHYLRDKTDLFRQWLQQSGDWSKHLPLSQRYFYIWVCLQNPPKKVAQIITNQFKFKCKPMRAL